MGYLELIGENETKSPPYILVILSIEKFIQHMFVSYAFYIDLMEIRSTVVLDHRLLMVSGLAIQKVEFSMSTIHTVRW